MKNGMQFIAIMFGGLGLLMFLFGLASEHPFFEEIGIGLQGDYHELSVVLGFGGSLCVIIGGALYLLSLGEKDPHK